MRSLFVSLVFVLAGGCGGDDSKDEPLPPPPQSALESEFQADVKPVLMKSCAGANCHTSGTARDGVIASGANFVNGKAKARLTSQTMPPPGSAQAQNLDPATRGQLIVFISKHD